MNQPPERALPKRIAATAAVVFGAALLIAPGSAAAQDTGADCSGAAPMADGIAAALDLARQCQVEVRVHSRSGPYESVFATPDGQIHLVATSGAVQDHQGAGVPDPALTPTSGTLAPTASGTPFTLRLDDADAPLIATAQSQLDWSGTVPVPSYSGATAVYDELAAGLDLTVDVGVSSAGLRFTADTADAWNALASGLTVAGFNASEVILYGSVRLADNTRVQNWTSPFAVRDAAGTVTPVTIVRNADLSLALRLPEGTLESAVFPLTLSTQWAQRNRSVNDWGSISSAAPDLGLFRGESGLDTPHFEAGGSSGDAVVGTYCDTPTDPECAAPAQAATYWNFWWPLLANPGHKPATGYSFKFVPTSAVFQVDAAAGSACVAPALRRTGVYVPDHVWDDRPTAGSAVPAAGSCEDGTAVYDVTAVAPAITESYADGGPVTFGMTTSAETARFDGESARLDVHFDIVGYSYVEPDYRQCTDVRSVIPWHDSTPPYGGFRFDAWQPDRFGYGFTWTASFKDVETGATVLTTDPVAVAYGSRATRYLTAEQALDDGWYEVEYKFTSASTGFTYMSEGCDIAVDTEAPEFVDITVEEGPHRIGDTVTVTAKVADGMFPDSINSLTISCLGAGVCDGEQTVVLTDTDTAAFDLTLTGTHSGNLWGLEMFDEAGHRAHSDLVQIPVTHSRNDYNGDGRQDLLAVRKSDGNLMFYAGRGDGGFRTGVSLGSGWGKMDVVMAGDLTGDGLPDVLARDTRTGTLYTYPGNGKGGLNARITVGTGWNGIGPITSAGDFNGDGKLDLYAVRKADWKLYLYPGKGNGTFGSRTVVDGAYRNWADVETMTTIGDTDLSGTDEILVREASGRYVLLSAWSMQKLNATTVLDGSLGQGTSTRYSQVMGVGDLDGDDVPDVVGIDSRTGELELHSVKVDHTEGTASALRTPKVVGTGWSGMRLASIDTDRTYDFDGSGLSEMIFRQNSGELVYHETQGSEYNTSDSWGTAFKNMTLLETAGDATGDGLPDLLARDASGNLYVYPGNGVKPGSTARIPVGSGWNSMSAIVGGQDFDGDGRTDIMARQKATGDLYFYPGTGAGKYGPRVKIGTGWNSMRELTAVGDLDHDGHADLIAVKNSDNCLYFYGGTGRGTLKSRVQIGCGFAGIQDFASVGDINLDGHADWIARRKSDGRISLYKGDGRGDYSGLTTLFNDWTGINAIV
jgi:hypothetical protein